jgi:hypothetical protein
MDIHRCSHRELRRPLELGMKTSQKEDSLFFKIRAVSFCFKNQNPEDRIQNAEYFLF